MAKKKRAADTPGNKQILLRLPPELRKPIDREAGINKVTVQAVIIEALARHYGVDVAAPSRGRPAKESQ